LTSRLLFRESAIEGIAGFADILLLWENGGVGILLVVECKRRTTPTWTFPIPNDTGEATTETRCLYTRNAKSDSQPQAGYVDATILPESPQAEFCVTNPKGENKGRETIEREASGLIRAAECIAVAHADLRKRSGNPKYRPVYVVPVIVTSFPLSVLQCSLDDVSIENGTLPRDSGLVETCPLVRFRKSLVYELTPNSDANDLAGANADRERTVLVIHASSLIGTLGEIGVVAAYQEDEPTFNLDLLE
jgi:hypothetical protein